MVRSSVISRRFSRGKQRAVRDDQSVNGVRVIVTRFYDKHGCSGTTVEADCACFGHPRRVHSYANCPLLKRMNADG